MSFENIFSKKESPALKSRKAAAIIIDNREKNSLVPSELVALGHKIEFRQLEIGDYIVNNIPIERKTISDLKSSIINKRVFSQLENLKQYSKYLLIIEGTSKRDFYSGVLHENALRGFLLSLALNQTPVIFTQDEKDTTRYLAVLARKKEKSEFSLRPSRIFKSKKEQIQFILEGFPNIGPKTAKKLIEEFKSLKRIVNAREEELSRILGKKAESFRNLLE